MINDVKKFAQCFREFFCENIHNNMPFTLLGESEGKSNDDCSNERDKFVGTTEGNMKILNTTLAVAIVISASTAMPPTTRKILFKKTISCSKYFIQSLRKARHIKWMSFFMQRGA